MTDTHGGGAHGTSDGLWRWLVGGLVGGLAVLGLLIGAYAVGHHRGEEARPAAAPAPTTTAPQATTAATTTAPQKPAGLGPVTPTPALVARGKTLFASDGCSGCHSLTGGAGAGPSLQGAAGRTTVLATGETVKADDAYLERSITDPDAQVVKGYRAGIMSAAVASQDLASRPGDVRALVAFVKSQR